MKQCRIHQPCVNNKEHARKPPPLEDAPKFPADYFGNLSASTSTFSIEGGFASNSGTFSISAAATLPER